MNPSLDVLLACETLNLGGPLPHYQKKRTVLSVLRDVVYGIVFSPLIPIRPFPCKFLKARNKDKQTHERDGRLAVSPKPTAIEMPNLFRSACLGELHTAGRLAQL